MNIITTSALPSSAGIACAPAWLKVTVGIQARAKKDGRGAGARFRIDPTGSLTPLAVAEGAFEGNAGWQTFGIVGYYQVRGRASAAVDNIAFDLLFSDGSKETKKALDGRGRIREVLLSAELV